MPSFRKIDISPSEEFRRRANINDPAIWTRPSRSRSVLGGWPSNSTGKRNGRVLGVNPPYAKFFVGELNAS